MAKPEKPSKKCIVKSPDGTDVKVRSKLEEKFAGILSNFDVDWFYEISKIKYTIPESQHTYIVDFTTKNGVFWECKGYLSDYAERRKYVLLKEQNPDLDIRFVFDNPSKLCGGTKMTHAAWAKKYNFPYCGVNDLETIRAWAKENIKVGK